MQALGATPVILQVNDVMPAVKDHSIDGIVTNWGNPLPGFNDTMKHHTDIAFYTSAFFVVMNRQKFDGLPTDVRAAIDELSNESLVTRFGLLWNKWDRPVREGASGPGHEVIVPDEAMLAQWHDGAAAGSRPLPRHARRKWLPPNPAQYYSTLIFRPAAIKSFDQPGAGRGPDRNGSGSRRPVDPWPHASSQV